MLAGFMRNGVGSLVGRSFGFIDLDVAAGQDGIYSARNLVRWFMAASFSATATISDAAPPSGRPGRSGLHQNIPSAAAASASYAAGSGDLRIRLCAATAPGVHVGVILNEQYPFLHKNNSCATSNLTVPNADRRGPVGRRLGINLMKSWRNAFQVGNFGGGRGENRDILSAKVAAITQRSGVGLSDPCSSVAGAEAADVEEATTLAEALLTLFIRG